MKVGKEEFLRLLHSLGGKWVVSSTPFGCVLGYSKITHEEKGVDQAESSVLSAYLTKKRRK